MSDRFREISARKDEVQGIPADEAGTFVRTGDYWTVAYGNLSFALRDLKGLSYIQRLLRQPGEEFSAIDLVRMDGAGADAASTDIGALLDDPAVSIGGLGDSGEMLDSAAIQNYQRRVSELKEELEDLRERGADERAEKVESEIDFLERELVRAVGFGGHDRRAGSASERARLNVTRAIKAGLRKVSENHAALGELLARSIRTGSFCSYIPDPRISVTWRFSLDGTKADQKRTDEVDAAADGVSKRMTAPAGEEIREFEGQTSGNSRTILHDRLIDSTPTPGLTDALTAPRLSIVVLPFVNLSGDPEQEYFADGVTESLITDLSRMTGGFVIARDTSFFYKDKSLDVRQLGRELNVRYVLEGSVQRGSKRMRVNVQLIDAETGNHLWADRFDKPVADLFDMQDEIVARLAGQLGIQLVSAEARRAERSPHPDALNLCFQGFARLNRGRSPEILAQARVFFDRALALDANDVWALVGGAGVDLILGSSLMTDNPAARFVAAETALTKALSLAPDYAVAHLVMGAVYDATNRAAQAIGACEHALALDRNLASAHAQIGSAKTSLGRAEETEGHILEALRLSPRDNLNYVWMTIVGAAKNLLARDEEAVAWLRRSIEANRNWSLTHFHLSAALANLGRLDEARAAAQAGLALDPKFTISRASRAMTNNNPTILAQAERVGDGMLLAGVPRG